MKRTWFLVALSNFLLASVLGALLRYAFVQEVSWLKFKNVLHAHSHVAMLGWIYLALFALLFTVFVPQLQSEKRSYSLLFWFTQCSVAGMLISFVWQGYGPLSIAFSGLHVLCSYVFVGWLWADLPATKSYSHLFLKTALFFMVLSTLAIWALGPLMSAGYRSSLYYHLAIQFYLHFQFNGWFIFGMLALFLRLLEIRQIIISARRIKHFYWLLVLSCFLTYALAVAWAKPLPVIFWLNSMGVILQLVALIAFYRLIRTKKDKLHQLFSHWERGLLRLALFCFTSKILIQSMVAIPSIAEASYTIRNYVIGFIHLLLLGTISFFLWSYASSLQLISLKKKLAKWGVAIFVTGVFSSEYLLFLQGSLFWAGWGFLPAYYELLFAGSSLIPLGIFLLLLSQFYKQDGRTRTV